MPLKTNISVSRKVSDKDFCSRGASVSLEVELDSSLVHEPEQLQERIRQVFCLAQQAVNEELARQQPVAASMPSPQPSRSNGNGSHSNGHHTSNGNGSNGNGHRNGNGHLVSEKQMAYARQLAGQITGFGVRKLETIAEKMFGKPLAALTSMDASGLIDTLKSIKAGEIDLDAVLGGITP